MNKPGYFDVTLQSGIEATLHCHHFCNTFEQVYAVRVKVVDRPNAESVSLKPGDMAKVKLESAPDQKIRMRRLHPDAYATLKLTNHGDFAVRLRIHVTLSSQRRGSILSPDFYQWSTTEIVHAEKGTLNSARRSLVTLFEHSYQSLRRDIDDALRRHDVMDEHVPLA